MRAFTARGPSDRHLCSRLSLRLAPLVLACALAACTEFPSRPGDSLAGDSGTDGHELDADGGTGLDTPVADGGDLGRDVLGDAPGDASDLGRDTSDDISHDPGNDFDGPGPGQNCRSHDECNDRRWCNGIEYCVAINGAPQGVCTVGVPQETSDGVPCTRDVCVECDPEDVDCERGLDGQIEHRRGDACECQVDSDCADALCGVGDCLDGVCGIAQVNDGEQCEHPCGQPGVCRLGDCVNRAEGPIQSEACRDRVDNDCDGNTDTGAGCQRPMEVTAVAPVPTGPAGIDAAGVTVEVSAWTEGPRRMPAQEENLYCTARRLVRHFPFAGQVELQDPLLNIADGQIAGGTVTMGVPGSLGGTGMQLCDRRGVVFGPFDFDDPRASLRVSLTVGLPSNRDLWAPADHQLVVGYSTPSTQGEAGEEYASVAAWSGSPITFGDSPVDFVIEQPGGGGPAYVRVEAWSLPSAPDVTGCFWIDHLTVASIRSTSGAQGVFPMWNGETAIEGFEARSAEDLTTTWRFTEGTHTLEVAPDTSLVGNLGLGWMFTDVDWAGISTPQITAGPLRLPRSVPLMLQMGMAVESTVATRPTSVGLVVQGGGIAPRKVAGATLNGQIPWLVNLAGMRSQLRSDHLHRLVLPEAAKTLLSLELLWVLRGLEDPAGRVLLDEVALFFHDEDSYDVEVGAMPSNPEDSVYRFYVHGRLPGQYQVQCHWQVPLGTEFETLSSFPVTVTLQ
jgi:hypothetical protein